MKISDIKINNRFRKDIGDLEDLKDSIQEVGLLQPVVIDENNNLIAGFRRITAFKELDKTDIPVYKINIDNAVKGEYDENAVRKNFTLSEAVAIWEAMERPVGGKGQTRGNLPQVREKASKATNVGIRTLSKAKQVVESGNIQLIKEMDKTGNVNRAYRKVKQLKRQQERILKTPTEIKIDIKCGDFRKLCLGIKPNSIDLILTDPPYPKEFLPLWEDLAQEAEKVLKPSGFLIAYSGQGCLSDIFKVLSEQLNYYWTMALYHKGITGQRFEVNMWNRFKPILIFQKSPYKKQSEWLEDVIISEKQDKELHEWGQSVEPFVKLLECFSEPNDIVLDPFLGGGAVLESCIKTKRNIIGYEIDKKIFQLIKKRL